MQKILEETSIEYSVIIIVLEDFSLLNILSFISIIPVCNTDLAGAGVSARQFGQTMADAH